MRKKLLSLIMVLVLSNTLFTQSNYSDSLNQIIEKSNDKITSFVNISQDESFSSSDKYINWTFQLNDQVKTWSDLDQGKFHLELSSYYVYKANDDSLNKHLLDGRRLFEKVGYSEGIAKLYGNQGKRKVLSGKYSEAQVFLDSGKFILQGDTNMTLLFLDYYTAINYYRQNKQDSALHHYQQVIKAGTKIGAKDFVMKGNVNSGIIYKNQGKFHQAQSILINASKEFPSDDYLSLIAIKINLMEICLLIDDYPNFNKYASDVKQLLNLRPEARSMTYYLESKASYYKEIQELDSCIYNLKSALPIADKNGYNDRYYTLLTSLIEAYALNNDKNSFLTHVKKLKRSNEQISLQSDGMKELGHGYLLMGMIGEAEDFLLQAKKEYEKSKQTESLLEVYRYLGLVYDAKKQEQESLVYLKKYILLNDSFSSDQIRTKMADLQVLHETQQTKDKLERSVQEKLNSDQLNEKEQAKKNIILISILFTLIVVGLFSVKLLKLNRQGKRKNKLLKEAEKVISFKNHQIESSIEYAQTIQVALLPSRAIWENHFPNSFVFFQPKDIVGGDYYWTHKNKQEKIFWATVDCTGHGVPGGFMTMIAHSILNKVIIDQKIESTSDILTSLDIELKLFFKNDDRFDHNYSEGMDMSICSYDKSNNKVFFSGAHQNLYLGRSNQLLEFKGSPFNIGQHYKKDQDVSYKNYEIEIEKGDTLYTFSDGIIDQMGGPKGKKFTRGRLKQSLIKLQNTPIEKQGEEIISSFNNWKKDKEQIDDVVVIGIQL